jgi:hypothetical protein
MLSRLALVIALTSFSVGCRLSSASPSAEVAKSIGRVTIIQKAGDKVAIPVGNRLTIVNIFDEFSSGCPTGDRFETMEHLNSLRVTGTTLLLVFSEKHFSTQDMENFRMILPMADSLVQGDIEAVRPHLTKGKLLVVLDSTGSVIWHEKPDSSEPQVFDEISRLIQPAKNRVSTVTR